MRMLCLSTALILAVAMPAAAQIVEVPAFESVLVGPLTISFEDVLSESRCPIDAVCIWEGDAALQFVIDSDRAEPQTFELHTHWSFGSQVEYDGYVITLLDVEPYPTLAGFPKPEDYVARLLVTGAFVPTETTSWSAVKARF